MNVPALSGTVWHRIHQRHWDSRMGTMTSAVSSWELGTMSSAAASSWEAGRVRSCQNLSPGSAAWISTEVEVMQMRMTVV